MRSSITSWMGTPYRFGGTTREGIDCSGFTAKIYEENGLILPRTAAEQWRVGDRVHRDDLVFGDLVFFATSGGSVSHVGIYQDHGSFVHAAVSKGVSVARLDDDYYRNSFVGARRVQNAPWVLADDQTGHVAVVTGFPMVLDQLPVSEAAALLPHRRAELELTVHSSGDLVFGVGAGLFNLLQLSAMLPVLQALGTGSPGLRQPGYSLKLNLVEERRYLPVLSLGYEDRPVEVFDDNVEELRWGQRRGAFLGLSKHYRHSSSFLLGSGELELGLDRQQGFDRFAPSELGWHLALRQQFFRRCQVLVEFGGQQRELALSVGLAVALTDDSLLEYLLRNVSASEQATGPTRSRALRLNYLLPF